MQGRANSVPVGSSKESGVQRRRRQIFNVAALIYFTLLIGPWQFSMPRGGQDESYHAVIAHALVSGWEWGRDIIATYGPLGILYSRLFLEGTLLTTAIFWLLISLVLVVNFLDLVKSVPLSLACILFLGFVLPFTYERVEPVFFVIPLLAAIGAFRAHEPVSTWKILLLVVLAGPAAMIKLTFAILSLLIFLALDADRALRKTLPLYTPVFLASMFAAYLYAGQPPLYFLEFLVRSAGAVSGYSEAMQFWGSFLELGSFLITCVIFGVLFWYCEFRHSARPRSAIRTVLYAICVGLFLFMIFKQGFVRQDVHTITSWDALSAGVAAYTASVWPRLKSSKPAICSVGIIIFASVYSLLGQAYWGQLSLWHKFVGTPLQQLASAAILVADTDHWLLFNRNTREARLAAIRKGTPLSSLDGSVDSIPSIQSAILADGLDYRPRPNIQEYTSYTESVINADRRSVLGDRAPRYIIHGTGSIDGRYPSLANGPMWPELLRLYEPLRMEGKYLLLRRRTTELASLLSLPVQAVARFGQGIAVPVSGAIHATIQSRQTLFGKIAQFLFKPGEMFLTVTLADHTNWRFRLVPEIARQGFVLSPLVKDNRVLAALSAGRPELFDRLNVVGFRVDLDAMATLAYEPNFEVQLRRLETDQLQALPADSEIDAFLSSISRQRK